MSLSNPEPSPFPARASDPPWPWDAPLGADTLQAALERETHRWAHLSRGEPVTAPALLSLTDGPPDPFAVLAELEALASMRARWDALVGHLGLILCACGLWRDLGFSSPGHYAAERLGMAQRTFEQRVALERRLYLLPPLRLAMAQGRLSYEKARLVARCPDPLALPGWIDAAERLTCAELRQQVDADHEAQLSARGDLAASLPAGVAALLREAFAAVRAARQRWLPASECLVEVCREFIATWERASRQRSTVQADVLRRDRHRCQVPGCTRPAAHVHHLDFRSHGGGDEEANLLALCLVHHLRGVHGGAVRVPRPAPGRLRFELGLRPGHPPLAILERVTPAA